MFDYYIHNGDNSLAELTKRYDALFPEVVAAEALERQLAALRDNRVSGGQRPTVMKDTAKWFDRERKLEAVILQMNRAVKKLKPLLELVRDECQRLRALPEGDYTPLDQEGEFKANILTAEALCDDAADYFFRYQWGKFASVTSELYRGSAADAQEWIIMESAYGSPFHFPGDDHHKAPPPPYMTFAEAYAEALRSEHEGEIVGLYTQLYNVCTGKRVRPKFSKVETYLGVVR